MVLLWLDVLDDFVFALALAWRSTCRCCLVPGLTAALVLTPVFSAEPGMASVALLSAVALSSVCAWLFAVAMSTRRSRRELLAPA